MATEVLCVKLVSGIDLIGRVVEDKAFTKNTLVLERVMQVQAFPSPQGIAVSLVPFLMFSEQSDAHIPFAETDFLLSYAAKTDLVTAYLEQTAGIALVRPANNVVPMATKF